MKVFALNLQGSYSDVFGWDNGINGTIGAEITFNQALEENESLMEYNGDSYQLPDTPIKGVYFNLYEGQGKRNGGGYIIASNITEAKELLHEFEEEFNEQHVIEY